MTPRRAGVNGVELDLIESGPADGDPVILAHGFPESSWSWRHQLRVLADAGWHAIAPDQRGYARSSRPSDVAAYGTDALAADLLGLLDETGHRQGVFVGHDWGALVVWDLARLHPDRVRAVVGVSVPFIDWPAPPTQLFKSIWGDRFFYITYFQEVGPPERELEADVPLTLRTVLWAASATGAGQPRPDLPAAGTGFLDSLGEPPDCRGG
jgi:pimeloyl-ACP methyl ester carboxylesterase